MTTFNIFFKMDNEAFSDNQRSESARILRKIADQIEAGEILQSKIYDVNGNLIGKATIWR